MSVVVSSTPCLCRGGSSGDTTMPVAVRSSRLFVLLFLALLVTCLPVDHAVVAQQNTYQFHRSFPLPFSLSQQQPYFRARTSSDRMLIATNEASATLPIGFDEPELAIQSVFNAVRAPQDRTSPTSTSPINDLISDQLPASLIAASAQVGSHGLVSCMGLGTIVFDGKQFIDIATGIVLFTPTRTDAHAFNVPKACQFYAGFLTFVACQPGSQCRLYRMQKDLATSVQFVRSLSSTQFPPSASMCFTLCTPFHSYEQSGTAQQCGTLFSIFSPTGGRSGYVMDLTSRSVYPVDATDGVAFSRVSCMDDYAVLYHPFRSEVAVITPFAAYGGVLYTVPTSLLDPASDTVIDVLDLEIQNTIAILTDKALVLFRFPPGCGACGSGACSDSGTCLCNFGTCGEECLFDYPNTPTSFYRDRSESSWSLLAQQRGYVHKVGFSIETNLSPRIISRGSIRLFRVANSPAINHCNAKMTLTVGSTAYTEERRVYMMPGASFVTAYFLHLNSSRIIDISSFDLVSVFIESSCLIQLTPDSSYTQSGTWSMYGNSGSNYSPYNSEGSRLPAFFFLGRISDPDVRNCDWNKYLANGRNGGCVAFPPSAYFRPTMSNGGSSCFDSSIPYSPCRVPQQRRFAPGSYVPSGNYFDTINFEGTPTFEPPALDTAEPGHYAVQLLLRDTHGSFNLGSCDVVYDVDERLILLEGSASIVIPVGSVYIDPGVSLLPGQNFDKNVRSFTDEIVTDGDPAVSTEEAGVYQLTYRRQRRTLSFFDEEQVVMTADTAVRTVRVVDNDGRNGTGSGNDDTAVEPVPVPHIRFHGTNITLFASETVQLQRRFAALEFEFIPSTYFEFVPPAHVVSFAISVEASIADPAQFPTSCALSSRGRTASGYITPHVYGNDNAPQPPIDLAVVEGSVYTIHASMQYMLFGNLEEKAYDFYVEVVNHDTRLRIGTGSAFGGPLSLQTVVVDFNSYTSGFGLSSASVHNLQFTNPLGDNLLGRVCAFVSDGRSVSDWYDTARSQKTDAPAVSLTLVAYGEAEGSFQTTTATGIFRDATAPLLTITYDGMDVTSDTFTLPEGTEFDDSKLKVVAEDNYDTLEEDEGYMCSFDALSAPNAVIVTCTAADSNGNERQSTTTFLLPSTTTTTTSTTTTSTTTTTTTTTTTSTTTTTITTTAAATTSGGTTTATSSATAQASSTSAAQTQSTVETTATVSLPTSTATVASSTNDTMTSLASKSGTVPIIGGAVGGIVVLVGIVVAVVCLTGKRKRGRERYGSSVHASTAAVGGNSSQSQKQQQKQQKKRKKRGKGNVYPTEEEMQGVPREAAMVTNPIFRGNSSASLSHPSIYADPDEPSPFAERNNDRTGDTAVIMSHQNAFNVPDAVAQLGNNSSQMQQQPPQRQQQSAHYSHLGDAPPSIYAAVVESELSRSTADDGSALVDTTPAESYAALPPSKQGPTNEYSHLNRGDGHQSEYAVPEDVPGLSSILSGQQHLQQGGNVYTNEDLFNASSDTDGSQYAVMSTPPQGQAQQRTPSSAVIDFLHAGKSRSVAAPAYHTPQPRQPSQQQYSSRQPSSSLPARKNDANLPHIYHVLDSSHGSHAAESSSSTDDGPLVRSADGRRREKRARKQAQPLPKPPAQTAPAPATAPKLRAHHTARAKELAKQTVARNGTPSGQQPKRPRTGRRKSITTPPQQFATAPPSVYHTLSDETRT